MGVTAGIFLASILLKEMRYLVYIRYLWNLHVQELDDIVRHNMQTINGKRFFDNNPMTTAVISL
jgi:hypothetical protein